MYLSYTFVSQYYIYIYIELLVFHFFLLFSLVIDMDTTIREMDRKLIQFFSYLALVWIDDAFTCD